jgi:lysine 2,3-aminomutase
MSDQPLTASTRSPPATLRTVAELRAAGLVAPSAAGLDAVAARYAIAVTPAMAALIDPANPADPMARQFLPDLRELDAKAGELADPIGDGAHEAVPGVVHRYPDRALLKIVHACPVYCRFCFRREMVGPGGAALTGAAFDRAIGYLAGHSAIREVIVTGGDPFMLSARRVAALMAALKPLSHVRVVRWHTRVPVVDPARVTPAFVRALNSGGKAVYVAVHANHPREFTAEAQAALVRLADAGIALLSQSVLLNGVNADAGTLQALMRAFVENRVKPYYLHHPDLAPGTGHFRVGIAEGQALVAGLRGHLSGLAQPAYVIDIPGGFGKIPVAAPHVVPRAEGGWWLTDRKGQRHLYRDA